MAWSPMSASSEVILNGVHTVPKEMTLSYQAVDSDSGRVASGKMERNMLGEKRKVELSYGPTKSARVKDIIGAISGVSNKYFTASFPDPWTDSGVYSGTFYVGDRTAPVYNFALDLYENLSFDIIEV